MFKTERAAREALAQQPFTKCLRERHEIVPCYYASALDEGIGIKSDRPVGYIYRLKPNA